MHGKLESLRQQRSHHLLQQPGMAGQRRWNFAICFRENVESLVADPFRRVDELKILDSLRISNQQAQWNVDDCESAARLGSHLRGTIHERVRLDRRDFKLEIN
jgi:hypothetical protein